MSRFCGRSSYLTSLCLASTSLPRGADNDSKFRNGRPSRDQMNNWYRLDIRRDGHLNFHIPVHWSGASQNGSQLIRVVSWNVNVLCGIASSGWVTRDGEAIEATAVCDVLRGLNADVVLLQEAMNEPDQSVEDDKHLPAACERVRRLYGLLEEQGYRVHRTEGECHGNHIVLATRLPADVQSVELDVGDSAWRKEVLEKGKPEKIARVALSAQLELLQGIRLGVTSLHLLHLDTPRLEDMHPRLAEMTQLLKHLNKGDADAQIVMGDFNQIRLVDLTAEEQRVIERVGIQTLDDGVDKELRDSGFCCCWDMPARRNFQEPAGGAGVDVPRSPPYTHWTGTSLDRGYLRSDKVGVSLAGAYVFYTELSDHLPIVLDVLVESSAQRASTL